MEDLPDEAIEALDRVAKIHEHSAFMDFDTGHIRRLVAEVRGLRDELRVMHATNANLSTSERAMEKAAEAAEDAREETRIALFEEQRRHQEKCERLAEALIARDRAEHERDRALEALESAMQEVAAGFQGPDLPGLNEYVVWALSTFPDETIRQQAIHLQKEAAELEESRRAEQSDPEELADVAMLSYLIFYRACTRAFYDDVDLSEEIRKKLEKNKTRRWVRSPEGDYQHVPEDGE